MHTDQTFANVLEALHAAPLAPERWNHFLEEFSAISGVTKAALIAHDPAEKDHRMLATLGDSVKDQRSVELYETCYCQVDGWAARFPRIGTAGQIIQGEEIWPEGSLLKSIFYNEFLKNVDVCQMACVAPLGASEVFEVLSIYRGRGEHPFDARQLFLLGLIVPHLRIALYTRRKLLALESRVSCLEATLDHMSTALLLIDAAGTVAFVNQAAGSILKQADGLVLSKSGLIARSPKETSKLRELIAKAVAAANGAGAQGGGAISIGRENRSALHVVVSPLRAVDSFLPREMAAIVFLSDPDREPPVPAEILKTLLGLTAAEARVALCISQGHSLAETAELNQVSRETVKSQLKIVFCKTGTQRQGQLVRLLSRLPITQQQVTSGNAT